MNRAGKRKAKKSGENRRPVQMSRKQLNKEIREGAEAAMHTFAVLYSTVLADKYNWSEEQIYELWEECSRYTRYIDDHVLRLLEVADILERKTGIKIKCRW